MGFFGSTQAANFGVTNGYIPGQIGVWGTWGDSNEVLRVTLQVNHPTVGPLPPFSFSFLPSHNTSFCRSLAVPQSVIETLRGRQGTIGHRFDFQFYLSGGDNERIALDQDAFEKALHGKAKKAPSSAGRIHKTLEADTAEVAKMSLEALKAKSDELRAAEAERQRLEAEKRAKEAAEAEAKRKADAAAKAAPAAAAPRAAPSGDPKTPTLPACKTVIIYGSSTGNTKNVAEMLKDALGNVDYLKNVTEITPADFSVPENIILGIPTWHIGELQDDWAAMLPMIEQVNPNVTGKKLAIFGLGDAKGYPDTYVDAIQMLWEPFEKRGAKLFGYWPTKGYEFQKSKALKGDKFMGLVIDIENQDNLSDSRVKAWATQIKGEMGL